MVSWLTEFHAIASIATAFNRHFVVVFMTVQPLQQSQHTAHMKLVIYDPDNTLIHRLQHKGYI
jgi:hypothetical protein